MSELLTPDELLAYADEVKAYRNLRFRRPKVVYSVKDRRRNRLIAYTGEILLTNVRFNIVESERKRAVLRHERNVHAYAIGTIVSEDPTPDEPWLPATYNPFKYETFVDVLTEAPIHEASAVLLDHNGMRYRP